ncbi:MAG: hypothetical protein FWC61_03565 [Proteobacteria bacterium]|nr:hypothetical protein [Pseudomonadota bacterium]
MDHYDILSVVDVTGVMLPEPGLKTLLLPALKTFGLRRTARMFYDYKINRNFNPDLLNLINAYIEESDFLTGAIEGMNILLNLPNSKVKICSNYGLSKKIEQTLYKKFNDRFNNAFADKSDFCLQKPGQSKQPFFDAARSELGFAELAIKKCGLLPSTIKNDICYIGHKDLDKPYHVLNNDDNILEIHFKQGNHILYLIDDDERNLYNTASYGGGADYFNSEGIMDRFLKTPELDTDCVRTKSIVQPISIGRQNHPDRDPHQTSIVNYSSIWDFATKLKRAVDEKNHEFFLNGR